MTNNITRNRRAAMTAIIVVLSIVYIASYYSVSRRADAICNRLKYEGIYFTITDTGDVSPRLESVARCLYAPMIYIDCTFGKGQLPASDPLNSLD